MTHFKGNSKLNNNALIYLAPCQLFIEIGKDWKNAFKEKARRPKWCKRPFLVISHKNIM